MARSRLLFNSLQEVGQKVARYGKAGIGRAVINEQNTKATLIQPIFRVLVRKSTDKQILGVSLVEFLQAGVIEAPLKVFRRYKGVDLVATVGKDGAVTCQGVSHTSCSSAAAFARGTVIGGAPSTNGWSFWQFKSADGQVVTLDRPRQEFLRRQKS